MLRGFSCEEERDRSDGNPLVVECCDVRRVSEWSGFIALAELPEYRCPEAPQTEVPRNRHRILES